ncbi:hypothetical protein [Kushneria pakistanensis]|uniref:hypothetical protein n=1 Tax=Kushneria pakistanensis TaxID=1508770 RepID=UPI001676B8B9|nr:hypothetical protein [Kushneria pakistanensis]
MTAKRALSVSRAAIGKSAAPVRTHWPERHQAGVEADAPGRDNDRTPTPAEAAREAIDHHRVMTPQRWP